MAKAKKSKRKVVQVKATYDAASTTTNNARRWQYTDSLSANEANSLEVRKTLYERSRYECANNSYANGIIETIAEDTIGTGSRLQFKIDTENTRALEKDWKAWVKETGYAKKQRVMRGTKSRDGEVFGLKISNNKLKNPVKLDLQLLETQRVGSHFNAKTEVDGVWLDKYGIPEYYNILNADPSGNTISIKGTRTPANKVIHYAYTTRPMQVRGIPETTPALEIFVQLRAYTLSTLTASETAANFSALLHTDAAADDEADEVEPLMTFDIERNTLKALPYGWKVSQLKPEQPNTGYSEFKGELLNEAARCLNIPFNVAAGNSSGYNFSSGRLDYMRYHKAISVERSEINRIINEPMFEEYVREWQIINGVTFVEGELDHVWMWDGHAHIDPVKSATAQRLKIENKTSNLAIECATDGLDWKDVVDQQLREEDYEKQRREELGLPVYDKADNII